MMFSFLENDDLVWFGVQREQALKIRTAGGKNHLENILCIDIMDLLKLEKKTAKRGNQNQKCHNLKGIKVISFTYITAMTVL